MNPSPQEAKALRSSLHAVDQRSNDASLNEWRAFAQAATPDEFCRSWLALQCAMIPGTSDAVLVLQKPDGDEFVPAAFWPEGRNNRSLFIDVTQRAIRLGQGIIVPRESTAGAPLSPLQARYQLAYPIRLDGQLRGVVAIDLEGRGEAHLEGAMRQLQWGSGWLEVLLRRGHGDSSEYTRKRLAFLVSLLSSYLDQTDMHAAINAIVTELATFLECDRVTIGMRYRRELRLLALSHSAQFDPHSNLARALEATMQEAIDQEVNLTYPAPETAPLRVTQAHARLAHGFDSSAIATIVVRAREQTVGALVFERAAARPFEKPALALMEGAAALLGPVLEMQRVAELPLAAQVRLRLARAWKELSGPHGGAGKLALAAVLILAVVGIFGKGDQRVSAETTIEGSVQRVLAAPFNGFISEVSARPGDAVHAGQVIARLDDRDLRLERLKVLAQREERDNLYREALAGHDRAQIGITAAQLAQAQAQLDLLDEQLRRTEVVAPFDGVIVKGDLAHALGEPIEKGQTLVEVAPLGTYRVVLEVDEHDIAALAPGEQGQLTLASLPGVQFPFVVSKITPVNTAREGRNFFRVEAQLQGGTERLRPGMEGIAKVVVAHRRYFSIWTHDLFNWVRLWIWSWMP